jgi:hypothetical protein
MGDKKIFREEEPRIEIKGNGLVHLTYKGARKSEIMPLATFQRHINTGMRAIAEWHRRAVE